jgi:hypothetical protein
VKPAVAPLQSHSLKEVRYRFKSIPHLALELSIVLHSILCEVGAYLIGVFVSTSFRSKPKEVLNLPFLEALPFLRYKPKIVSLLSSGILCEFEVFKTKEPTDDQ